MLLFMKELVIQYFVCSIVNHSVYQQRDLLNWDVGIAFMCYV